MRIKVERNESHFSNQSFSLPSGDVSSRVRIVWNRFTRSESANFFPIASELNFFIGTPSEVYVYGINIVYVHFPLFIVWIFVYNVIIPVFFELQIVSIYEVNI